jgi:hypothetical protein
MIVFQTRRSYTYKRVPPEIYAAMKAAFAKGPFFNQHIPGEYAFVRNVDVPGFET